MLTATPRPFFARQVEKNLLAYDSLADALVPGSINESEMTASFVISTKSEDREGDIVEPRGFLDYLDEYGKNPIVLFDHSQADGPIGLSEDKQKRLTVRVQGDSLIGTCHFHGKPFKGVNLSEEVFNLVVIGALRGASPGFLPIDSMRRGYTDDAGTHYKKMRLTEWSVCPLPCHQDALRMSLSRGYVKTKSLRSHLESYLPAPKVWSPGANLEVSMSKLKTAQVAFDKSQFSADDALREAKAMGYQVTKALSSKDGGHWVCVLPGCDGLEIVGKKEITKGITALKTKKFKKNEEKELDVETPEDEMTPVEKGIEEDDKGEDEEVELDDDEGDDEEIETDLEDSSSDEADESEEETGSEEETAKTVGADSAKESAKEIATQIVHLEAGIEHLLERLDSLDNERAAELFRQIQPIYEDLKMQLERGFAEIHPDHDLDDIKASLMPDEGDDLPVDDDTGDLPFEDDGMGDELESGLSDDGEDLEPIDDGMAADEDEEDMAQVKKSDFMSQLTKAFSQNNKHLAKGVGSLKSVGVIK